VNDALSFRAYNVPQYGPDGFVNNASHATKWKDHEAIQDAIDLGWEGLQKKLLTDPNTTNFEFNPRISRIGNSWGIGFMKNDPSQSIQDYNNGFKIIFKQYPSIGWKITTMYPE
jgi:hypothetical protein